MIKEQNLEINSLEKKEDEDNLLEKAVEKHLKDMDIEDGGTVNFVFFYGVVFCARETNKEAAVDLLDAMDNKKRRKGIFEKIASVLEKKGYKYTNDVKKEIAGEDYRSKIISGVEMSLPNGDQG